LQQNPNKTANLKSSIGFESREIQPLGEIKNGYLLRNNDKNSMVMARG
jgi:hypothetical protein